MALLEVALLLLFPAVVIGDKIIRLNYSISHLLLVMSPSKSTNDRSCDGSQDRKVDRLDIKTTFP